MILYPRLLHLMTRTLDINIYRIKYSYVNIVVMAVTHNMASIPTNKMFLKKSSFILGIRILDVSIANIAWTSPRNPKYKYD
jgi:hypothetical protein